MSQYFAHTLSTNVQKMSQYFAHTLSTNVQNVRFEKIGIIRRNIEKDEREITLN